MYCPAADRSFPRSANRTWEGITHSADWSPGEGLAGRGANGQPERHRGPRNAGSFLGGEMGVFHSVKCLGSVWGEGHPWVHRTLPHGETS